MIEQGVYLNFKVKIIEQEEYLNFKVKHDWTRGVSKLQGKNHWTRRVSELQDKNHWTRRVSELQDKIIEQEGYLNFKVLQRLQTLKNSVERKMKESFMLRMLDGDYKTPL